MSIKPFKHTQNPNAKSLFQLVSIASLDLYLMWMIECYLLFCHRGGLRISTDDMKEKREGTGKVISRSCDAWKRSVI